MPPKGTKVDRLSEAERKIDALQRQVSRLDTRPAIAPSPRMGRALGKFRNTMDNSEVAEDINTFWFDGSSMTIDNAAAVDKGGGLVGIPITAHIFRFQETVLIGGTTNYNGRFDIVSETANEIVIKATFIAEAFAGSETVDGKEKSTDTPIGEAFDWLNMPGNTVLEGARCIVQFMNDGLWYVTGRRQIEYAGIFTATADGSSANLTMPMSILPGVSPQSAGFDTTGSPLRIKILYAGEYGYDFMFRATPDTAVAATLAVTFHANAATPKGLTVIEAEFPAGTETESRSGSGVLNCLDDEEVWLSYVSGGDSPSAGSEFFLRLWSINVDPRP